MWYHAKSDTFIAFRFVLGLSFCNGCKNHLLGATPSYRFAICCFAHICPVSGFRTEWGRLPDRVAEARTCGKQGLVWARQKVLLKADSAYELLKDSLNKNNLVSTNLRLPLWHNFRVGCGIADIKGELRHSLRKP